MKIYCTKNAGKADSSSSATLSNLEGEQLPLNHTPTATVKSNDCCIPYKAQLFYRATFLSSATDAVPAGPCAAGRPSRSPAAAQEARQQAPMLSGASETDPTPPLPPQHLHSPSPWWDEVGSVLVAPRDAA